MACEAFIEYRPQAATRRIINQANAIIAQYLDQGLKLTLRQLFYQFVARALLENVFRNYKRLGWIVASARDGGLIDWGAMEDRTREVHTHSAWDDPSAMIRTAAYSYAENLWRNQRYRPEVWIEKSALQASSKASATSGGCPTSPPSATAARPSCTRRDGASPTISTKA